MKYLDDVLATWLNSPANCCGPSKEQALMRVERPMRIEHQQPRLVPPPIPEPQERPSTRSREWVARSKSFASRASSRGSFSVRRKLNTYNGFGGPRRPRIGAPSDFRHVENAIHRRTERFRPLELSIYMPENQLSPILPHFRTDDLSFPADDLGDIPYPPTAMTHSRSESALSFRIPRKPIRSDSGSSEWTAHFKPRPGSLNAQELLAALEKELPKVPHPARLRAMTEPPTFERVKSALHEKFELEQRLKAIDEVIEERRSIYLNSRPTSRATVSRPTSVYAESHEPMPPVKPTFAERVALPPVDQRPKTAPSKTVHIPTRLKSFTEASAAFNSPSTPPTPPRQWERALPPPPLPLVLQAPHPPLRKKKSFSRVSNWLFPGAGSEHSRNISLDSVTNTPKPVTSREGFYQCVELKQAAPNISTSSVSTVSTVSTLEETMPTTWTPHSSPGRGPMKTDVTIRTLSMDYEREDKSIELTRMRTFGEKEMRPDETWRMEPMPVYVPGRDSVGVAF